MKTFDVLTWIRGVRDARHEQELGLTGQEKLRRTRQDAAAWRASRTPDTPSTNPAAKGND